MFEALSLRHNPTEQVARVMPRLGAVGWVAAQPDLTRMNARNGRVKTREWPEST